MNTPPVSQVNPELYHYNFEVIMYSPEGRVKEHLSFKNLTIDEVHERMKDHLENEPDGTTYSNPVKK